MGFPVPKDENYTELIETLDLPGQLLYVVSYGWNDSLFRSRLLPRSPFYNKINPDVVDHYATIVKQMAECIMNETDSAEMLKLHKKLKSQILDGGGGKELGASSLTIAITRRLCLPPTSLHPYRDQAYVKIMEYAHSMIKFILDFDAAAAAAAADDDRDCLISRFLTLKHAYPYQCYVKYKRIVAPATPAVKCNNYVFVNLPGYYNLDAIDFDSFDEDYFCSNIPFMSKLDESVSTVEFELYATLIDDMNSFIMENHTRKSIIKNYKILKNRIVPDALGTDTNLTASVACGLSQPDCDKPMEFSTQDIYLALYAHSLVRFLIDNYVDDDAIQAVYIRIRMDHPCLMCGLKQEIQETQLHRKIHLKRGRVHQLEQEQKQKQKQKLFQ